MENYFKDDENIKSKLVIIYVLFAISVICGKKFPILSAIASILIMGYFFTFVNIRIFRTTDNLPQWDNYTKLFLRGLPFAIVSILYAIATIFIQWHLFFAASKGFGLGNFYGIYFSILPKMLIIFFLISYLITPTLLSYATNLKLKSFFSLKGYKHILITNAFAYFKYFITISTVFALYLLVAIAIALSVVGVLFLPLLMTYSFASISDLSAKFIRTAFRIKPAY